MFGSFLKIGLRYLLRNKTYSVLNFICLTFGLICAVITVLYIVNVCSYDKFHKNYNRLYSVEAYVTYFNGARFPKQYLSASLPDLLKAKSPEIEEITRVAEYEYSFVNGNEIFAENGYYADNNFFDVFSFSLIHKSNQMLTDLNSIVISETMATKFFKSIDCVGKTLVMKEGEKQEAFKVTGVFKKVPKQSLMQFDFVIPFSKFLADNKWALETGATANQTWVLLNESVNSKQVENKIQNLIKSQETTLNQELFLFPLKEKILYSYAAGERVWREMRNVVIAGTIGFAILLIACFNFINLAIALNIRRYREAGIRKVSGSGKSAIVFQFLSETFIITFISLIAAVVIVNLLLPGFNAMFNNDIRFELLDFNMILFFIGVTLFTCLASGLLPALYLSSSNPISVLKGKYGTSNSFSFFRQSLIVFQFAIPIVLIICMLIIKTQDKYMRNYDIGVVKDKVIVIDNSPEIQKHVSGIKNELLSISGITAVSFTNCIPSRGTMPLSDVSWEGKDASQKIHFWCINSDFDYNKTVNINLIEGRFFNPKLSSDSATYMINDVAAQLFKYKNPVGSSITVEGRKGTIIGVFNDFHAIDLAGPIVPTIIRIKPNDCPALMVKFAQGSFPSIKDKIGKVIKHYDPEGLYQPRLFRDLPSYSELGLPANLVGIAFIIALLLACMGLFGLASFTSESRTKEIGIRKANGATTGLIIRMLLSSYTKWLLIAFVAAVPVAFMVGRVFLGRFNFHTPMPYWAFLIGPFIALVVALSTVSSQAWRAASRNPVKSLRYE